ncbi:MAG TPA: class I SAM-dependent methyltransferase [Thermomicrobiales bacterium]|nr:class I SAM-dependent methyltransferase [Thermomicrobiales bacterium]
MADEQAPVPVDETRAIWDAKADYWDERMGEGNLFHRELVGPAVERLLAIRPDELVLDVACGNGQLARRLATLGARVVATDFSARFLELASTRTEAMPQIAGRVEYRQVDATDPEQLAALVDGRYDAITCLMGLMDMPDVDPLLVAVPRLLRPGGRFVFAIQHPCFNSNAVSMVVEEDASLRRTSALKLSRYLTLPPARGAGMPGEPESHWYFHRPLGVLLGAAFRHGLVMDGIEEPALTTPPDPVARLRAAGHS